jgi:hypothetical protein
MSSNVNAPEAKRRPRGRTPSAFLPITGLDRAGDSANVHFSWISLDGSTVILNRRKMELGTVLTGAKFTTFLWEFAQKHWPFRTPKISVSAFTYAAAGSEDGVLMIGLPLVFSHSSPQPVNLEALRLIQVPDHGTRPLTFTAILQSLNGTRSGERHPDRLWSQPIVIQANQPATHICQFLRKPGRLKEADAIPFQLQVRLANSDRWQSLREMRFSFTQQFSIRTLEQP